VSKKNNKIRIVFEFAPISFHVFVCIEIVLQ
jgi:hypothetical protein